MVLRASFSFSRSRFFRFNSAFFSSSSLALVCRQDLPGKLSERIRVSDQRLFELADPREVLDTKLEGHGHEGLILEVDRGQHPQAGIIAELRAEVDEGAHRVGDAGPET